MAGSWVGAVKGAGSDYSLGRVNLFKYSNTFIADAADGSIPDWVSTIASCFVVGVGVVFGTPAPNSLTVNLKDSDGLTVATQIMTASGRVDFDGAVPIVDGFTLTLTGNTTNSATAQIVIYLMDNLK